MKTKQRHNLIIQELKNEGSVNTVELSEIIGVSSMTIRRDLAKLAEQGLVTLNHGGAIINRGALYEQKTVIRENFMVHEKKNIAKYCADLVNEGDCVFLDAGTTAKEIAAFLVDKKDIVVLTSSIYCANILSTSNNVKLIMLPGEFNKSSMAFLGPITNEFISKIHVDIAFIATEGIDVNSGATVFSSLDGSAKELLVSNSKQVVIITDSSKFGKSYLFSFCPIEKMDLLVTDSNADEDIIEELSNKGLKVVKV